MMSATTQVRRSKFEQNLGVNDKLREIDPKLYVELTNNIKKLKTIRNLKGGKKSYDCLVAGYFNDMTEVIFQVYKALKSGADFILVLGDSAPYGIYIPTHEYLARIALGIGFSSWSIEKLRKRGDKWKNNPQRHNVKLQEVVLTLTK
jgi:hypothetical protein